MLMVLCTLFSHLNIIPTDIIIHNLTYIQVYISLIPCGCIAGCLMAISVDPQSIVKSLIGTGVVQLNLWQRIMKRP